MYPSYHRQGRDMILYFLKKHFGDKDGLITPMKPLEMETDEAELARIFCKDSFKDDYRILNGEIRKLGFNIPPLVNAYMSLSPTMRMFGTAINYGFGDVEETGILIAVDEILEEKRMRHIESFVKNDPEDCQITSGVNKWFSHRKSLHRRKTVPVDFAIKIQGKDIGHARNIIEHRLYSLVECRRFYIILSRYAVNEQL